MSNHTPRLRIRSQDGVLLLREALRFTFYMPHPHAEVAQQVQRSLDVYLQAAGPYALDLYADDQGDWWTLDDEGWKVVREQFHHPTRARIHLADVPAHERSYQFDYLGKRVGAPDLARQPGAVSAVSFWLPTDFLEKHGPERVRELALELAGPLPFCSGHAGLSFSCDLGLAGVPRELLQWCFRYPGLDIPDLDGHAWRVGTQVQTLSWLIFLGQPVLGELGGATGLRSRLQTPGTAVQEIEGNRAVITLGLWPEAGDTEAGQLLPAP